MENGRRWNTPTNNYQTRKLLQHCGDKIMGYKIPDLKEDIKKALQDWSMERRGIFSDEVLDLHDIIDKHFKKIER